MTDVQTKTDTVLPAEEPPARPGTASTRRLVLLGAGAVGATAVLAACGTDTSTNTDGTDYSDDPAPAGSTAAGGGDSGDSGDSGSTGGSALAATADVPEGGGVIKGDYVITQPTSGTYRAFSKVCTHAGCDVNKVDGGVISCPCHGSTFSIETGEPTAGPATKALAETKVKADGDSIVKA